MKRRAKIGQVLVFSALGNGYCAMFGARAKVVDAKGSMICVLWEDAQYHALDGWWSAGFFSAEAKR